MAKQRKATDLKTIGIIQSGGRALATVRVVEHGAGKAILKDFNRSSWLFRNSVGRLLVILESRAYRRLQGVRGVPRLLSRASGYALLIEYIPGLNCLKAPADLFSEDFFKRASRLLADVRARGVLHLDVAGNILISDGEPWLIDFTSAVVLPQSLVRAAGSLSRLRAKYDERAVLKLKMRRAAHLLTPDENEQSAAVLPFEGWAKVGERFVKRTIAWLS